jgi:hypothetical protein
MSRSSATGPTAEEGFIHEWPNFSGVKSRSVMNNQPDKKPVKSALR